MTVAYGRRLAVISGFFFFQAEDGIRDLTVTGVQTCALPISGRPAPCRTSLHHRHLAAQRPCTRSRSCWRGEFQSIGVVRRVLSSTCPVRGQPAGSPTGMGALDHQMRSEEHTSELQSQSNLVCRLLLEKKKNK